MLERSRRMKRIFAIAMLTLIMPSPTVSGAGRTARATQLRPRIHIVPSKALIDENVNIRLSGFKPSQRITVRARMKDDSNRIWESSADFLVDKRGKVRLDSQKPLSGT